MTLVASGSEVLAQAFDGVDDAITVVDLDGIVTHWNRAAVELYCVTREDAIGRKIVDVVRPFLPDDEANLVMASVAAGQKWSGQMLVRCGDLRTRLLQITNLPLYEDGRVAGLMGIARQHRLGGDGARGLGDGLVVIDRARHISVWSTMLRERLGYDLRDRHARELADLVHPDDAATFARLLAQPSTDDHQKIELRLRNSFDGYSAFTVWVNDLIDVPGVSGLVLTLHPVVERLSGRAMALMTANQHGPCVFTLDLRGIVTRWRPGAEHLYGWTAAEMTGHPMSRLDAPGADESERYVRQALRGRGPVQYHAQHVTKSGQPLDVAIALSLIADDDGAPLEVLAVIEDITPAVNSDARDTTIDALTGLPKRPLVFERLRTALTQVRLDHGVAVLVIDVDSFKLINDSLGHSAGDELLVAIGQRLSSCVSAADIVGRLGSDEFVVACSNLPGENEATNIAARILDRVSKPVLVSGHEVLPHVSIGIAVTHCSDVDPAEFVSEADTAMYRAKANGRARYEVFDQAIHQRALLRLELEEELRRALREHELRVRYQPVLSLEDGTIRGVEALLRWEHPDRGLLLPSEFLPMAEETGLIVPIGRQVIADACAQLARWQTAGSPDLTLAINLSPRQLTDSGLLGYLRHQIALHGVAAESIVLELTEHALLTEAVDDPASMLREFRDAGFRLSIDDFGTGYCSLLYLRHFPVTQLKLDRFFIAGLGRDPLDEAIIESVLRMAHALGLEAVAEGIERPEQLAHLRRLGCGFGQGFLWAPALDGDELLEMLPNRHAPVPEIVPLEVVHDHVPALVAVTDVVSGSRARASLVLVDDSAAERTLLRVRLEETGCFDVIAEAANGRDGIDVVGRLQPDLVVLDLSMPGMDGLEVLSELREVAPRAVITILSGYVSPSVGRAALARGAVACLDKNASLPRLVDELVRFAFETPPNDLAAS
jgi:diguanylate cyclase (GGDEF)-like protein/PAS domain S-box-containing protein